MEILAQGLLYGGLSVAIVICAVMLIWVELAYGDSRLELLLIGLGAIILVACAVCLGYCCWGFIGVFLQTR